MLTSESVFSFWAKLFIHYPTDGMKRSPSWRLLHPSNGLSRWREQKKCWLALRLLCDFCWQTRSQSNKSSAQKTTTNTLACRSPICVFDIFRCCFFFYENEDTAADLATFVTTSPRPWGDKFHDEAEWQKHMNLTTDIYLPSHLWRNLSAEWPCDAAYRHWRQFLVFPWKFLNLAP